MKLISSFFLAYLLLIPGLSRADILVYNNTNQAATGYMKSSPCSSAAGDRGVAKPKGSLSVPSYIIFTYCGVANCDAHIYMSSNCSGKEVVRATINSTRGVLYLTDLQPDLYHTTISGNQVTISPVKNNLLNKLFHFLF